MAPFVAQLLLNYFEFLEMTRAGLRRQELPLRPTRGKFIYFPSVYITSSCCTLACTASGRPVEGMRDFPESLICCRVAGWAGRVGWQGVLGSLAALSLLERVKETDAKGCFSRL